MIGKDIDLAISLLEAGEVVAIPTETVYGLAGNALNENAVKKIFKAKNRPEYNPLIIHVAHHQDILRYVKSIPKELKILSQIFMPGPLTLLLDKNEIIPDLVTANSKKIAVRIPNHPITKQLLSYLDFPLAAPSANPFGYISPTSPHHVEAQLGNKISYILDGGLCEVGIESTIVGMEHDRVIVYRKGGVSIEEITNEIGEIYLKENNKSLPITPGMLASHYSPTTRLKIGNIESMIEEYKNKKLAILAINEEKEFRNGDIFYLSQKDDFKEVAKNLYKILREIDLLNYDYILAELLPEVGLGSAINDRLRRASYE